MYVEEGTVVVLSLWKGCNGKVPIAYVWTDIQDVWIVQYVARAVCCSVAALLGGLIYYIVAHCDWPVDK